MAKRGKIYVLVNVAFFEYVKIGYTENYNEVMDKLNNSYCLPIPFVLDAYCDTDTPLTNEILHRYIDEVNPKARGIDTFMDEPCEREFYRMDVMQAFKTLGVVIEKYGIDGTLQRCGYGTDDKKSASPFPTPVVRKEIKNKKPLFSFVKCGIPFGSEIVFKKDKSIVCTVFDDRRVIYNGEKCYLTALAQRLLNRSIGVVGAKYFTYQGKTLFEIRRDREIEEDFLG